MESLFGLRGRQLPTIPIPPPFSFFPLHNCDHFRRLTYYKKLTGKRPQNPKFHGTAPHFRTTGSQFE